MSSHLSSAAKVGDKCSLPALTASFTCARDPPRPVSGRRHRHRAFSFHARQPGRVGLPLSGEPGIRHHQRFSIWWRWKSSMKCRAHHPWFHYTTCVVSEASAHPKKAMLPSISSPSGSTMAMWMFIYAGRWRWWKPCAAGSSDRALHRKAFILKDFPPASRNRSPYESAF